jgi:hypothetical protein
MLRKQKEQQFKYVPKGMPYRQPLMRELVETAVCIILGFVFILVVSVVAMAFGAR